MSKPIPREKLVEYANKAVTGLACFALVKSTDPEKQKDLERLQELRIEVQDILDRLVPGWGE